MRASLLKAFPRKASLDIVRRISVWWQTLLRQRHCLLDVDVQESCQWLMFSTFLVHHADPAASNLYMIAAISTVCVTSIKRRWMSSYQSHFFFSMLSAAVIRPQGHIGSGKWGLGRNILPWQKVLLPLWWASLKKWLWKKLARGCYSSRMEAKTARLQKFQTQVATAAGYVPPGKLLPTSDAARFHSHHVFR